jgi:hypothetical protein
MQESAHEEARPMSFRRTLKREVRVALSRRAQPVWFRVLKWVAILAIVVLFRRTPYLWLWILGAVALGLSLHLVWRWKTRGWTRPWGGWDDTETAGPR